jgi:hypothetical protein
VAPIAPAPSAWQSADIGAVGATGSQRLVNGTWTVSGSGADIYSTADGFHFAYGTLTGDGSLSARATSQTYVTPWAKTGVMLRASTDPSSAFYAAILTPGFGAFVEYRSQAGGTVYCGPSVSATVPDYLKVVRAGNTFSAYSSTDGSTWTLLTGSTTTLSLPATVLDGLAVTSHDAGVLSTVAFDTVQL